MPPAIRHRVATRFAPMFPPIVPPFVSRYRYTLTIIHNIVPVKKISMKNPQLHTKTTVFYAALCFLVICLEQLHQ